MLVSGSRGLKPWDRTQSRTSELHRSKKLRPALGGELAAREPVWDGEGWGCDRVAGS